MHRSDIRRSPALLRQLLLLLPGLLPGPGDPLPGPGDPLPAGLCPAPLPGARDPAPRGACRSWGDRADTGASDTGTGQGKAQDSKKGSAGMISGAAGTHSQLCRSTGPVQSWWTRYQRKTELLSWDELLSPDGGTAPA